MTKFNMNMLTPVLRQRIKEDLDKLANDLNKVGEEVIVLNEDNNIDICKSNEELVITVKLGQTT